MITLTQRISSEVNKVIKISVSEIENETKGIKKKVRGIVWKWRVEGEGIERVKKTYDGRQIPSRKYSVFPVPDIY